ncbi:MULTISPECIES: LicD family protein [unclassified Rickettsia]|uniref:LicD family protein n=1 Tax=unclassified Rickettsia TaxID=114295 RepID=UPI0031331376
MMKLKSVFSPKNILGSILLLFASIFFYTHVLEHDWRYKVPTDEEVKKYRISENTTLSLYQIMKDTHELLTKHNINYWIDGGTLLGAVRHQGIIPYDDDLDIGIMQEDEIRLQQIFPEFQKLGYSISHDLAYKICQKGCIDIFTFQKDQNKFIHSNLKTRTQYPNDFFYDHELLPLKKYKFGDIEVYGPYNPKENLNRQYPEWDKYAVIHHPHNFHLFFLSNIERKTKFILTPELLKPAKALKPLKNRVN